MREQFPAMPDYDIAIIEALDKVTAESLRFEAPPNARTAKGLR